MVPMAIRKLNAERGQSILEFAITALLLFLLVFAIIDYSHLYFDKLTLQNAVRQGGRYAITGQSMPGNSRYLSILATVRNASLGMAASSNTTVCSQPSGNCNFGGGPNETVTITVNYLYRINTPIMAQFFPGGTYLITVSSSFRNEPFPPSSTY
jgi:Flp pilus assembly protein TadG